MLPVLDFLRWGNNNMKKTTRELLDALFMGTESLTKRLTTEEAEVEFSVALDLWGPESIPFGALFPQWQQLKAKIKPSDELWEFRMMFPRGDGVRGVKLVRRGKVIDTIGALWIPDPNTAPKKRSASRKKAVKRVKRQKPDVDQQDQK